MQERRRCAEFASEGGTLVFLNRSAAYATQTLGVKAKNVMEGVSNREFYAPGSLLNVELDTHHPLTLGLPREITIWSSKVRRGKRRRRPSRDIRTRRFWRRAGCWERTGWPAARRWWMRGWARAT